MDEQASFRRPCCRSQPPLCSSYWPSPENIQVVVCVNNRAIVILPDKDVDLGPVADDERIVSGVSVEAGVTRFEAYKMKADDPRIAGMQPGKSVTFRKPTIFKGG